MSYDQAAFNAAISPLVPEKSRSMIPMYWALYNAASSQIEYIVLGREIDIKGLVDQHGLAQKGGHILLDLKGWDTFCNDSWILGGIHAKLPFFVKTILDDPYVSSRDRDKPGAVAQAMANHKKAIYPQASNPTAQYPLFVTTREMAGLMLFGYSRTSEAEIKGQKYVCSQPDVADRATFNAYIQHVGLVEAAVRS